MFKGLNEKVLWKENEQQTTAVWVLNSFFKNENVLFASLPCHAKITEQFLMKFGVQIDKNLELNMEYVLL